MDKVNFNHKLILKLGIGFFLISILLLCFSFIYRPLNIDGGSYLLLAREISRGSLSGPANGTGYTPLVMWVYGLFLVESNSTPFQIIILLNISIIVANAMLLVVFISKEIPLSKSIKSLLFTTYLLFQLLMEGTDIILEPWVVLFMMLGLLLIQSKKLTNYLLAGAAISFSFLSKQYGLASLGVLISYLFFIETGSRKFIKILLILVGLSFTTFIFWLLFSNIYLAPSSIFSNYFNSSNYHGDVSLSKAFYNIAILVIMRITFLSYLVFKSLTKRPSWNSYDLFSLACIVCFLPAFYNKQYIHYFHLILPFLFLIISCNLHHLISQIQQSRMNKFFIVITFIISICSLGRSYFNSIYFSQKEQSEIAQKLTANIPQGSPVFIQDPHFIPFYYLCNFEIPGKAFSHDVTKNFHDSINQDLILKSKYLVLLKERQISGFMQISGLNEIAPIYRRIQKE